MCFLRAIFVLIIMMSGDCRPAAWKTASTKDPACSVLTWKKESGETLNISPFTLWLNVVLPKSLLRTGNAFSLPKVAAAKLWRQQQFANHKKSCAKLD